MKHCVQLIFVSILCGCLGQSTPDSPAIDLLPPFEEEVKPRAISVESIATSELPPFPDSPRSRSNTQAALQSTTETPTVTSEENQKSLPKQQTFESISPNNFHNSPALSDGSYKFSYNLETGIHREEEGSLQPGQTSEFSGQNVNGGYSYTAPDGQVISVKYVADEFGYRPVGSHIPAIPEPIARALKYLQSKAQTQ
uniref:Uncharacterized protein n=1 Tax=Phlebotomus papatasi TaxID=29031 RepID=A0A1B0D631_PHLPP